MQASGMSSDVGTDAGSPSASSGAWCIERLIQKSCCHSRLHDAAADLAAVVHLARPFVRVRDACSRTRVSADTS